MWPCLPSCFLLKPSKHTNEVSAVLYRSKEDHCFLESQIIALAGGVTYEDLHPLFNTSAKKTGTRIAAMITLGELLGSGLKRNPDIDAFIASGVDDPSPLLVSEAEKLR